MSGERYKIIIGMDIIRKYKMTLEYNQDLLRFRTENGAKVNLKMTPRTTIFKTKQVSNYRNFLRSIQGSTHRSSANEVSEYADMASVCPLEEDVAEYVGPELTSIAAIS